jgi:pyridoxamine 5'-phosphate oxidase
MNRNTSDKLTSKEIAELRRRYTRDGLREIELPEDPVELFRSWLTEAVRSEVPEPNAMTLSTVDLAGNANGRTVLLKGIEDRAFSFYTNYRSVKADELEKNSSVCATFWWPQLERQTRLRGNASRLPEEVNEEYFRSRPRESKLGAWASNQSSVINGRSDLEQKLEEVERTYENEEVPKPDYWGGYRVDLTEVEFWQGRPGRLHDRILYTFSKNNWKYVRLAP